MSQPSASDEPPGAEPSSESAPFTPRAIFVGLVLGAVFGVTNLYAGLRLGVTFTLSLAASVLSFAFLTWMARLAGGRRSSLLGETTLAQTIAGAAMSMPSSGLVHAIPAMAMAAASGVDMPHVGFFGMTVWVTSISFLGVIVAAGLRKMHVDDPRLKFPSSTASAHAMRAMSDASDRAFGATKLLVATALGAAGWRWITSKLVTGGVLAIPLRIGRLTSLPLKAYGLGLDLGTAGLATGILLGPRVGVSIGFSALVTFGLIGPRLVDGQVVRVWGTPDGSPPPSTWSAFEHATRDGHGIAAKTIEGVGSAVARWSTWPGAALVVTASLVALALRAPSIVTAVRALSTSGARAGGDHGAVDEVPRTWLAVALVVVGAVCTGLEHWMFGVAVPLAVVAVLLSIGFAAVAARVYGETDSVPSGPLGKVTQLLLAVIAPGSVGASLVAANVTGGAAAHAAELLGDLKLGALLRVSPRRQLFAQLLGICGGGVVSVAAYRALVSRGSLGTPALPAVAARTWYATAELLANGLRGLPAGAATASMVAVAVGAVIAVVERLLPPERRRMLPSAVGLGLGMLLPASISIGIFAGAMIGAFVNRRKERSTSYLLVIAAGAMIGESLIELALTLG